ncbi:hypothetical protein [Helicobacter rodentium]|uniref:hypothetical protein n=1 Tax=Helicobacter rodentium TaxID=59617 RepID=UPI00260CF3E8|nr:hypothetical protein [Helicobacter rodentium]
MLGTPQNYHQGEAMDLIPSKTMIRGKKCNYSAKYFYAWSHCIVSKASGKIVDIQCERSA